MHDHLAEAGYRAFLDRNSLSEALTSLRGAVRTSSHLVAFLSPGYFSQPECVLEALDPRDLWAVSPSLLPHPALLLARPEVARS